jgi:predicted pyridoxine 5'-phosphate oxidase superfamily flavin-nucleotide-binding protein
LGKTVENLRANGKICLAVYDKDWNGLKIFGTAEYVTDGEYYEKIKSQPENLDMPAKGGILVKIDKITEIG